MEKFKIALGSNSYQKINYLKEILKEIEVDAEVITSKVESGVSDQPLSEQETFNGSLNRAKNALKEIKDADFAIGIEVGYHKNKEEDYEIFCCASIVDRNDFSVSCSSGKFLLPKFHQEKLKNKMYLGHYTEEHMKRAKNSSEKKVREIIDNRKPFIKEALRNALLRYIGKEEF